MTSQDGKVFGTLSMVSISDDKKSAVFSGPINGHPDQLKYTIYPKPDNNGEIKVSVNGENHNAPMYGEISGKNSQFQYAGGLVKLSMKGANGAKVNVPNIQTTPNAIGGTYKFNLQKGEMEYHPGSTPVGIESIPADGVVYLPVATTAIVNGQKQNIDKVDLNIFIGSNLTPVSISDVPVMNGKISTDKVPNIEVDENGVVESGVVVTTAEQLKATLSEQNNAIKNIKLAGDIDLLQEIENTIQDVILDLNGYRLIGKVINNGGLTIVDSKYPEKERNLECLTIKMHSEEAVLNLNKDVVVRVDNTILSAKLTLPEEHKNIIYFEDSEDSNLYSWYQLKTDNNYKKINTIVIGENKTFEFDNTDMSPLLQSGTITADELEKVVDEYFSNYSKYVTRLELKDGSKLQVAEYNSEAASGYATVVAEGDVTIQGWGKDNSTLYLCGGSDLVIKKNSEVHVNNITIGVGNNGDGSFRAHVIPADEKPGVGEQWGKIIISESNIWNQETNVGDNKTAKIEIAEKITISKTGQ